MSVQRVEVNGCSGRNGKLSLVQYQGRLDDSSIFGRFGLPSGDHGGELATVTVSLPKPFDCNLA